MNLAVIAAVASCAAGAAAFAPGSSMPEPGKIYYQRQNCHLAYDQLIEDVDGGRSVSDEDRAWARTHEAAGAAGQPCPAPPERLARRAANRVVATQGGLAQLVTYYKKDDPTAWFEAAQAVLTGKVPQVEAAEGFAMLKKAADLGDPSALFMIGSLHVAGAVTGKADYAAGLPFIEGAAKAGHVDALFMAGTLYKEGMGTKADARKAFDYQRQAAERGHSLAAMVAFDMINEGQGTKKDLDLAYRLGRNLADRGEAYGAVMAASALLQRKDVLKHEDEVLYWMDTALRDGDEKIRTEVGKFRPQVIAAYKRAKAPPEYRPRVRKLCPLKTTCLVNSFTGLRSCTTNVDYWNDCDG
jgi:TPR repeat protein